MKLPRHTFLHLAAGAAAPPVTPQTATAEQTAAAQTPLEPLALSRAIMRMLDSRNIT